jgi:hypothetical protein
VATDDTKRLGYGGSAEIDGIQVLVTSGGFTTEKTPSVLEAYSLQPSTNSRARMKHADGVEAYSGEVSLDVTKDALPLFSVTRLLSRGYMFKVGVHDGEKAEEMDDCLVTSLTLSGMAGGLITASVSVASASAPEESLFVLNDFIRDNEPPYGYWYSGNTDVRDWTLSMTQDASPVYVNEDETAPRYLRIGLFDFSLQVTTYEQLRRHDSISIATSSFTLQGDTTSEAFQFTGVTDLGTYAHSFETAAAISVGSGDTIIT